MVLRTKKSITLSILLSSPETESPPFTGRFGVGPGHSKASWRNLHRDCLFWENDTMMLFYFSYPNYSTAFREIQQLHRSDAQCKCHRLQWVFSRCIAEESPPVSLSLYSLIFKQQSTAVGVEDHEQIITICITACWPFAVVDWIGHYAKEKGQRRDAWKKYEEINKTNQRWEGTFAKEKRRSLSIWFKEREVLTRR